MGEFPSGQRGQTVNLLRFASMVRIRPPPPNKHRNLGIKITVLFFDSLPKTMDFQYFLREIQSRCGVEPQRLFLFVE